MKILIALTLFVSCVLVGCNKSETSELKSNMKSENTSEDKSKANNETESTSTLQSELNAKKKAFEEKATDEKKKMYAEGQASIEKSGIIESAKNKGDKAPDFVLTNAAGEKVSLSSYLKKGPVILTWYRGGWCPYCNITLNRLQKELPNFNAAGANLIALTPELPDSTLSSKEKNDLQFEVLSDPGNKIAKEYGIVFKLYEPVAESYQKGFDLHGYNGDESDELPLAATYVINPDGTIIYAFLDADYRNRAEPSEILEALK